MDENELNEKLSYDLYISHYNNLASEQQTQSRLIDNSIIYISSISLIFLFKEGIELYISLAVMGFFIAIIFMLLSNIINLHMLENINTKIRLRIIDPLNPTTDSINYLKPIINCFHWCSIISFCFSFFILLLPHIKFLLRIAGS